MIRPRLDAAATIEDANVALAAPPSISSAERASALRRSADPIGAWLLDAETRAAARLPGRWSGSTST